MFSSPILKISREPVPYIGVIPTYNDIPLNAVEFGDGELISITVQARALPRSSKS